MRVFRASKLNHGWGAIKRCCRSKAFSGQDEVSAKLRLRPRLMYATGQYGVRHIVSRNTFVLLLIIAVSFLVQLGCRRSTTITFTEVPPDDLGGAESSGVLAGHVSGFSTGDKMMLFAFNGKWWVQPAVINPFTPIAEDGSWKAQIHLGHEYAALLVRGSLAVQDPDDRLPAMGGPVLALKIVPGTPTAIDGLDHSARVLHFGGQEWKDTFHVSEFGGRPHYYLPQNAWVDDRGHMHLRINRVANQWTCAEVKTDRALGYGTYRFTFENPSVMEPAVEFGFFNMDVQANHENFREMDFHVSRWGDPRSTNSEYVVQPYYLPANVHSFEIPPALLTTTLHWSKGQAAFSTERDGKQLAAWKFTAGVPSPLDGNIYLNLCVFGYPRVPLQHETEFVVNDFSYLP